MITFVSRWKTIDGMRECSTGGFDQRRGLMGDDQSGGSGNHTDAPSGNLCSFNACQNIFKAWRYQSLTVIGACVFWPSPPMHVWISTDWAYVKNRITQWMGNWVKNNRRTRNGKPVANRSLWKKLIEVVKLHARVEWSWVKAHSGIVLNECADMLATRGVNNVKRPQDAQESVGEGYVPPDGEEAPTDDWYEERPPERTLIWKN
jgi:hypothetical protein